jgi:hypothetical protein
MRADFQHGDPVCHRLRPDVPLIFKFDAHRGDVVCTYAIPPARGPIDLIMRRSDCLPRPAGVITFDCAPGASPASPESQPMSYSFSAGGLTKALAKADVDNRLQDVAETQKIHARDRAAAQAAADAMIDQLVDPTDAQRINVSMSGSLAWSGDYDNPRVVNASVQVNAWIAGR